MQNFKISIIIEVTYEQASLRCFLLVDYISFRAIGAGGGISAMPREMGTPAGG
jgi:hypothetical protein